MQLDNNTTPVPPVHVQTEQRKLWLKRKPRRDLPGPAPWDCMSQLGRFESFFHPLHLLHAARIWLQDRNAAALSHMSGRHKENGCAWILGCRHWTRASAGVPLLRSQEESVSLEASACPQDLERMRKTINPILSVEGCYKRGVERCNMRVDPESRTFAQDWPSSIKKILSLNFRKLRNIKLWRYITKYQTGPWQGKNERLSKLILWRLHLQIWYFCFGFGPFGDTCIPKNRAHLLPGHFSYSREGYLSPRLQTFTNNRPV